MTRARRKTVRQTPRAAVPADVADPAVTLVGELRRITEAAEAALARRAQLPAADRESWTIEVETDHGLVMLIQTIRLSFGHGGPGNDPPEYVLRAYDCPGEARNYHITLPEPAASDGPFRGVTARQIADNHDGLSRLLARARALGLLPDGAEVTAMAQPSAPRYELTAAGRQALTEDQGGEVWDDVSHLATAAVHELSGTSADMLASLLGTTAPELERICAGEVPCPPQLLDKLELLLRVAVEDMNGLRRGIVATRGAR